MRLAYDVSQVGRLWHTPGTGRRDEIPYPKRRAHASASTSLPDSS
jgi:hypothetical protein